MYSGVRVGLAPLQQFCQVKISRNRAPLLAPSECIHPFHSKTHHAPFCFQVFLSVMASLPLSGSPPSDEKLNYGGCHGQAQERQQTRHPGACQPFVHLYGKQRESSRKRAPDKRVCRESARGVGRVRLDGEGEDACECQKRSHTEHG